MSIDRRTALLAGVAAAATAGAGAMLARTAFAVPAPNAQAPLFTGQGSNGETVDLEALRGQKVVLEWTNHDCPFVRKHYGAGAMQALQQDATADGVVWISIISSAPGTQGFVSAEEANALTESRAAAASHIVLDPEGTIGRLYGARTTPHMFVIDEAGAIVYMGGIDDKPSARPADIEGATNYVRAALGAMKEGRTPEVQSARPYGCSVKYAS